MEDDDKPDAEAFTPAQMDALEKAYEILGEHFDTCLIGVSTPAAGSEKCEASNFYWRGGYVAALGLAMCAQHAVTNSKLMDSEP